MNKEEYYKKRDSLFQRWQNANSDYTLEGKLFTIDGIVNFDAWIKAFPIILFLFPSLISPSFTFSLNIFLQIYVNKHKKYITLHEQLTV